LQWGAKAAATGSVKGMGKAILASQYLNVPTYHFNLVLDTQRLHRPHKCVGALGAPIDQGHLNFGANNGDHQARNSCSATQINAGCDTTGQRISKGCCVLNDLGQGGRP
jgi:hypothetical protein